MLKKLFTNDKFFLITVFITVLCTIIDLFSLIMSGADLLMHLSWISTHLLIAIFTVIIYISYLKHNKNIMKAVIGMLFGVLLMSDISSLVFYLSYSMDVFYGYVYVILDIVLIVNHLVLNSNHSSRPLAVKVNQITLLLQATASVLTFISTIKATSLGDTNIYDLLSTVVSPFLFVFAVASIVCVESRLDLYKAIREQKND